MVVKPVLNVILNTLRQSVHKFGAWCDDILVKFALSLLEGLIGKLDLFRPLIVDFLLSCKLLLNFKGTAETATALLVHFCSWCYTIDCHVHQFLRFAYVHDFIHIFKYVIEHLCVDGGFGLARRPSTRVDNSIHVKVQVVDLGIIGLNFVLDIELDHGFTFGRRIKIGIKINLIRVCSLCSSILLILFK